ncbi:MAG: hypothetical protein AAB819_00545 [Patescibacteria group bacterium]
MENIEQNDIVTLEQLKEQEEVLRIATEDAQKDLEHGKTTEAVFEDLQARYLLAKQAREDFEAKS